MRTIVVAELGSVYSAMSRALDHTHCAILVQPPKGAVREVANAGWLLRNWKSIHDLHVTTRRPLTRPQDDHAAIIAARMVGGVVYATTWADKRLLHRWLCRPVLRGRPLYWDNSLFAIGEGHYHTIVTNELYPNPKEKVNA